MLKLERNHQTVIAHLDGEIDHHHVLFLRATLDRVLEDAHATALIFDLENVEFMDSSGIGLIIGRYKRMKARGGQTYIGGSNAQVERILRLSGIDALLGRLDDQPERSAR